MAGNEVEGVFYKGPTSRAIKISEPLKFLSYYSYRSAGNFSVFFPR